MRTETSRLQSPLQPVTDDSVLALLFSPPHDVLRLVLCCLQEMCRNTIFKRVQLRADSLAGGNHLEDDPKYSEGDI